MADLFLDAVRNLHQQRAKVRAMTPERRAQMFAELGDDAADGWVFAARDAQLPPAALGWCWLFLGGRGAGPIPQIIRYKRRVEWPNGAACQLFSGEEPDQFRGPQAQLWYIDELAKMRYAEDVFDNAMLGLRLGDKPRMLITTTPRPTAFMKKLLKTENVSITTSSTFANTHLSADFLKRVREQYEGTRAGCRSSMAPWSWSRPTRFSKRPGSSTTTSRKTSSNKLPWA